MSCNITYGYSKMLIYFIFLFFQKDVKRFDTLGGNNYILIKKQNNSSMKGTYYESSR